MKFRYIEGVPNVEEAIEQAVRVVNPSLLRAAHEEVCDGLLAEVRSILAGELRTLIDDQDVAKEWNSALEVAIEVVRGELA
ncbi:hypothetical protein GCM10028801_30380 [Nocardioides maradonensis]